MRRSDLFIPTTKETESSAQVRSAELALRSGLISQLGSGLFSYSPTGKQIRTNIENIVHEKMRNIGAQGVDLPGLQYADIWKQSGRFEKFEGEMYTFENRDHQEMCLAPTHEEPMADLVRNSVRSSRNMPLIVYQIGKKFRDDHARNGLLRTKEFTMKDAYSFNTTEEGLDEVYDQMREAYIDIFDSLGVEFAIVSADPGAMGGTGSEEFQAPADIGSDEIKVCTNNECYFGTKDLTLPECEECGSNLDHTYSIELGHIFKLGTRYSDPLELNYNVEGGEEQVIMGSYGIGISRLIPALIEQNNDSDGILWPETVAPFKWSIIPVKDDKEIQETAEKIHNRLNGPSTILFDNDVTAGEKFAESDLIGIPKKIILGNTFLEDGTIELEYREGDKEFYTEKRFYQAFA